MSMVESLPDGVRMLDFLSPTLREKACAAGQDPKALESVRDRVLLTIRTNYRGIRASSFKYYSILEASAPMLLPTPPPGYGRLLLSGAAEEGGQSVIQFTEEATGITLHTALPRGDGMRLRPGFSAGCGSQIFLVPSNNYIVVDLRPRRPGLACSFCAATNVMEGLKKCAQCRSVAYCSRKCQVAHWKAGHKEECRQLAAEAAGQSEAAAAAPAGEQEAAATAAEAAGQGKAAVDEGKEAA